MNLRSFRATSDCRPVTPDVDGTSAYRHAKSVVSRTGSAFLQALFRLEVDIAVENGLSSTHIYHIMQEIPLHSPAMVGHSRGGLSREVSSHD